MQIIGDFFNVNGRKCCWLKESGKPAMLSSNGKDWQEYDTLQALKKAERKETFEELTVPENLNVDDIFELLVFAGPVGLKLAKKKIESFENSLYKTATPKIDSDVRVAIWSSYPGLPGNSIRLLQANKNYSNVDQINQDYQDNENILQKLTSCLSLSQSIPENEIWKCCVLFGTDDVQTTAEGLQLPGYTVATENNLYNYLVDEPKDLGVCFYEIILPDGSRRLNIDTSKATFPETVCTLSTALLNGSAGLSDIQLYLTSYDTLSKKLAESSDYESICQNTAFRKFVQDYCEVNDLQEIDANDFYTSLVTFIDSESNTLESSAFAKAFRLISSDELVKSWRESLSKLAVLVDSAELVINLVTTYNVLVNIKTKLWQLFQAQDKLAESKNSKIAVKSGGKLYTIVKRT